ncbi:hypothetical protein C0585_06555 [Candidatus Woesearchaeota archaeon]|nr:MAG: hypothetical protein C0585_06555 [Candidatus Woesearchaeota archaeon]
MVKKIQIDYITKIEGHAKLYVKIDEGIVKDVRMEVFEGARLFESLLIGKKYDEVPIITSRICGVCPQAHSIASIDAIEKAFGHVPNKSIETLRELLLIGQIIKSHTLHLYFLALPDFFNKRSVIELAKEQKEVLNLGIRLKKLSNEITTIIGGREIHSITNIPGGFTKAPTDEELTTLQKNIKSSLEDSLEGIKLFSSFSVPDYSNKTEYLYLKKDENPNVKGTVICSDNICNSVEKYADLMNEFVEEYSSAKHVTIGEKSFFVGALSRINQTLIPDDIKKILDKNSILFPSYNPYYNNLAQCIEIHILLQKAKDLIKKIDVGEVFHHKITPKKGKAVSALEAPRGILFHEYSFDDKGYVTKANIITPTTQNLKNMENDIMKILPSLLDKPEEKIKFELEKLIRAYDPCISCSTHFLDVIWE